MLFRSGLGLSGRGIDKRHAGMYVREEGARATEEKIGRMRGRVVCER